ncbi:MAG: D-alanyl-D-alanine carboxypeptidase [Muribaculaceae bacterium]|nr:D-alanyl-D-alanine carboxypeptidase [Muribaculaceae bacterium]
MSVKNFISTFTIIIAFSLYAMSTDAKEILGIKGEKHSSIGIYIKDLQADTVVFESEADKCLIPASITKSYTSATAMSLIDSDFRFETKVYLTGAAGAQGEWNGDLIIKASGDPTLESEYFKKTAGFLKEIVIALQDKGVRKINGDIILARVDEMHDYPEGPLSTWPIGDVCWSYAAGAFDFNWCDNYFGIFPATGKTSSPVPGLKYTVWKNPWTKGLDMIRGVYSDSLIIMGKQYATDPKARVNTSMPYPFNTFREMLVNRLQANDIKITLYPSGKTERTLLLTHKSVLIDEILRSLMVRSDNMFAESVLRMFGEHYGDRNEALDTQSKLWSSRGLQPEFNRIYDGSGLSRINNISPRYLGQVLEWMVKSEYRERYLGLFPVSGVSGTMKSFMADTPLKGRLAFKTGSVNSVQSYAGYVTDIKGNPTHVVVIMVNNFYCSRNELRLALKKLLLNKLEPWI